MQAAQQVAQRATRRVGSAGNALRETIRSVFQESSDRCFFGCGLYLLGLASLGLLDAALIVWVWRGQGKSLELSLAIAGFVDVGVLLLTSLVLYVRQMQADRVQQEQLQAAVQAPFQPQPGEPGAGGPWELAVPLLQPLIPPLVEVLQTAAAKGTSAVRHGAQKVSRLAHSGGPGPEQEEEGPDIEDPGRGAEHPSASPQEISPKPAGGPSPRPEHPAPTAGYPGPERPGAGASPRPGPERPGGGGGGAAD